MNRFFSLFNSLGVVALCVLSSIQWQTNSRLEHNVAQLDQTRVEQSTKILEQSQTLKDDAADMVDLRQRLTMSESQLKATISERDRLAAEGKLLKAALDKWIAAVKERDAAIKQAGDLIQKLAAQRDDAIMKFNDLAGKYNALIKQ